MKVTLSSGKLCVQSFRRLGCGGVMRLHVLHAHPKFMEECAGVLNEEWPRSITARLHSLEKSNDKLPMSFVLVNDDDCVVGHSRISSVQGDPHSCFVESVVVRKSMRGKGYGRKLMEATELYVRGLGMTTVYLTTTDKEAFYGHLGYTHCQPIISLGCASGILSEEKLSALFGSMSKIDPRGSAGGDPKKTICNNLFMDAVTKDTVTKDNTLEYSTHPTDSHDTHSQSMLVDMKSPPPPPLPPLSQPMRKTQQNIQRLDSRHVKWMMKVL